MSTSKVDEFVFGDWNRSELIHTTHCYFKKTIDLNHWIGFYYIGKSGYNTIYSSSRLNKIVSFYYSIHKTLSLPNNIDEAKQAIDDLLVRYNKLKAFQ